MWYKYTVSEVIPDMLRYDRGYIAQPLPIDEARTSFFEYEVYEHVSMDVYSPWPPTVARWNSFGVGVSNIERVEKPTTSMHIWTNEPWWSNHKEWVYEVPRARRGN